MQVDGAGYCHVDQYGGDVESNGRQRYSVSCVPQSNHHNRKNNLTSMHGASLLDSGFRPPVLGLRIVCIEEYAWNGQRGNSSSMRVWGTPARDHKARDHVTRVQMDAENRSYTNTMKPDMQRSTIASRRVQCPIATIRKSMATM